MGRLEAGKGIAWCEGGTQGPETGDLGRGHLFNGLLNHLHQAGVVAWEFVENHTEGFAEALKAACSTAPSLPAVAATCDLREEDFAEFYRLFTAALAAWHGPVLHHRPAKRHGGPREVGALAYQLAAHMDLEDPVHRGIVLQF